MKVSIKLFGGLEQYLNDSGRKNKIILKLSETQTIKQLIEENRIPIKLISLIVAGNKVINLDYKVQEDDVIKVFPQIGGG